MISSYPLSPCEKCSIYRGRIYCISGKDKRFPKLSDYINPEEMCCLTFSGILYHEGVTLTKYYYDKNGNVKEKEVDALTYSNRPYVDDRDDFEKQQYRNQKEKDDEIIDQEKRYYSRDNWVKKYIVRLEYHQILMKLGEKAPKSFNGYMRMKKGNTINYQRIVKMAEKEGIVIHSLDV